MTAEQLQNKEEMILEMETFILGYEEESDNSEFEEVINNAKAELEFFKKDDTAVVEMLFNSTPDFPFLNIVYHATVGFNLLLNDI